MKRARRMGILSTAVVLAGASCGSPSASSDAAPAAVTFPAKFMWGASTAAFQVEKGDLHTDWARWVTKPGKIKNGDQPDAGQVDALAHVDDDVRLLVASGQTAYRFSIEWGRVYPTRAAFDADTPDPAAIAAYDALIDKLLAAHLTPLVTLHHFAFPDWLSDVDHPEAPQGWERPETQALFAEWSRRMAAHYKDKVDWWVTINEPLVMIVTGYIQGGAPPGVILDATRAFAAAKAEIRANAAAYDAIHQVDTADADGDGKAAWVSIAAHQRTWHPSDPTDPDDKAATEHVRYVWNLWFLNAMVKGDFDDDLDGKLDGPNDRRAAPELSGRADYLGINYYSDTLVSAHRGLVLPVVKAAVAFDHLSTDRPKTDYAWDIYPEGLRAVLDEVKPYGLPVVVTENGIADRDDKNRARFIAEHLYQLGWAIADGVDVRGYFHWSLVDNFEWAAGFCPRFGLATVDPATGARALRASASTYRSIAQAGKVARADLAALPPYSSGTFCP